MKTPIKNRDLTQEAPHSPRDRFGEYVILGRTVDKCRASLSGKQGEYHYDCPLDNQLFGFKGITGDQFKAIMSKAKTYEEVADWLSANGEKKSPQEIKAWSDKTEALKLRDVPTLRDPGHRREASEACQKLGLDFETVRLFEWLEADDKASHQPHEEMAGR